ncbi:MAG: TPR repeat protein [Gammaproteobacteria bacterium]|jgi:TPR repeat protein
MEPSRLRWFAWLALLCSVVVAADFDAGVEAYSHRDFDTAYREWLPLAQAGDSAAQLSVAALYSKGQGVETDHEEAAKWYGLAADQGVPAAQFTLGLLYARGIGRPLDAGESAKWFGRAARQGDADAQFALALAYSQGIGVAQDSARAVWWFRQAAIQNMAVAQATLGLMYELGRGVEQSNHCAYAWFKVAGGRGSVRAREKRDSLRALMTPQQIEDAETLADTLLQNSECPATR